MKITKEHIDKPVAEVDDHWDVEQDKLEGTDGERPNLYYLGKNAEEWFDQHSQFEAAAKFIDQSILETVKTLKDTLSVCSIELETALTQNARLTAELEEAKEWCPSNLAPDFVVKHWPRYTTGEYLIPGQSLFRASNGAISVLNQIVISSSVVVLEGEKSALHRLLISFEDLQAGVEKPIIESSEDLHSVISQLRPSGDAREFAQAILDELGLCGFDLNAATTKESDTDDN